MLMRRIAAAAAAGILLLMPAGSASGEGRPVDLGGCRAALLMERNSGSVIIESCGDEPMDPAGLARLPALLAVCGRIDAGELKLEDETVISREAAAAKGSTAFLEAGDTADIAMLLKAAVMITAADAIYALSEAAFGSYQACMMAAGDILADLGVSERADAGGAELYTARELALIGAELMKSDCFSLYSALYYDSIEHEGGRITELASSNKLLRSCPGAAGVATGSSAAAKYCGVFGVTRGESSYVAVVLGAEDSSARSVTARDMLEYGFAAYDTRILCRAGEVMAEGVPVKCGVKGSVDLVAASDRAALIERAGELHESKNIPAELYAPIDSSAAAGSIEYSLGGQIIAKVELYPAEDIALAGVWDHMRMALLCWLRW